MDRAAPITQAGELLELTVAHSDGSTDQKVQALMASTREFRAQCSTQDSMPWYCDLDGIECRRSAIQIGIVDLSDWASQMDGGDMGSPSRFGHNMFTTISKGQSSLSASGEGEGLSQRAKLLFIGLLLLTCCAADDRRVFAKK